MYDVASHISWMCHCYQLVVSVCMDADATAMVHCSENMQHVIRLNGNKFLLLQTFGAH